MSKFEHTLNQYGSKVLNLTTVILAITLFLFAFFLFQDIFLDPEFAGDESKYLADLLKANEFGLGKAISDGASITYLVISYFLNIVIDSPLFSLKITSLITGISMFLFLYFFNLKFLKIAKPLKQPLFLWLIYLFVIQTTFFAGINDILLDLFGTLLFISFFIRIKSNTLKVVLFGLFIALALATRKMAIIYSFSFFSMFVLFAIIDKGHEIFNFKNGIIIFISFGCFFTLLNFYPLIKNNKFSFDDKVLKGEVNWAQWDYHNALLIDQGKQNRFTHVNIEETKKYMEEHGKNSLPSTFLEMVYFDPLFTFKEFFIDLLIGLKYIFRQTGLLVIAFSFFLFFRLRRMVLFKTASPVDFIYVFSIFYVLLISFIVIANIQARWFMFFMPVTILFIGKDLDEADLNLKQLFSIGNNLLLSIMCFPYLINKITIFF